ncbi:unnamed protein product, partial [Ectocarpus sp. 8 AP-2014]
CPLVLIGSGAADHMDVWCLMSTRSVRLSQVLPFILLGLGVDDSFVICNAFGRTDPRKSIPERMREGL